MTGRCAGDGQGFSGRMPFGNQTWPARKRPNIPNEVRSGGFRSEIGKTWKELGFSAVPCLIIVGYAGENSAEIPDMKFELV